MNNLSNDFNLKVKSGEAVATTSEDAKTTTTRLQGGSANSAATGDKTMTTLIA